MRRWAVGLQRCGVMRCWKLYQSNRPRRRSHELPRPLTKPASFPVTTSHHATNRSFAESRKCLLKGPRDEHRDRYSFLGVQCVETTGAVSTELLLLSTAAVGSLPASDEGQERVAAKRAVRVCLRGPDWPVVHTRLRTFALHRVAGLAECGLLSSDVQAHQRQIDDLVNPSVTLGLARVARSAWAGSL
jgi:hypothetical protein